MRILATLIAMGVAAPALACGVCHTFGANPLALPHPRAIEVAVAVRAARDDGVLGSAGPAVQGWDRQSGLEVLESWRGKLRVPAQPPFSLHIVLIDRPGTLALHVRSGQAALEAQPTGTADAIIVTHSAVLAAVASGKLPLRRAVELGVLIIDGERRCAAVLAAD